VTGGAAGVTGARELEKPNAPTKTENFGGPAGIPQAMEMRWETRINIRKGNGTKSSGFEYAWRRHGGNGTSNKSQFTIPRQEVEELLQNKQVIQTKPVKSPTSGNYIREVNVGKIVGKVALDKGGQETSVITVITDRQGNLVNVFPGDLGFKP
jgi:filamentous hemagglutinin